MKKTMINFRTVAMALVTTLALGFAQSTYAAAPGVNADLKFVGNFNTSPVFQLE